ncbi:MAG: CDP-alcohol phosphatidyltransferase family protein [Notoacmeibacter sp.]|nr:CDP-alcohol phosphatidyltransferase family protein [Notoacmeibacter sp.]
MLDGWARRQIDPQIRALATVAAKWEVSANAITVTGCVLAIAALAAIAYGFFLLGLVLILSSRLCDGLDGAVATIKGQTDFGGFLDIVLDFVYYGAIPFGFVLADPASNAIAGAALIFSFYVNGASFLAYAVMAEKRALDSNARGSKSLYFTTGLAEATETLAVFVLACLMPAWFPALAWIFAVIVVYTAFSRVALAARTFR